MADFTLHKVIGPPGCGKTTYLSRQVRLAHNEGKDVLLCSLTRAAAAELAGRDLPIPRENIGTLHAHAYRSLSGGFAGIADDPKHLKQWNEEYPLWALSDAEHDIDEDNADMRRGQKPGDEHYAKIQNHRARMEPLEWWGPYEQRFYKDWRTWKDVNGLLDFTDLLEIALRDVPSAPGSPDIIFADERQDFSELEKELLYKWGREAGTVIEAGDPWQNLYEWRGSDPQVFYAGDATEERVLRQSYRIPRSVHGEAMAWIREMPDYHPIEYYPTDHEGEVSTLEDSWAGRLGDARAGINGTQLARTIERLTDQGSSVMVLASCGYMLGPVISWLRSNGIPFYNPYRRKNGRWNPLMNRKGAISATQRIAAFLRIGNEGKWSRDDLRTWLSAMKCSEVLPSKIGYKKFEEIINGLPEDSDGVDYASLVEHVGEAAIEAGMNANLAWLEDHAQSQRASSLGFPGQIAKRYGVEKLYEEPKVIVGTIHSVKGGEADYVILAPDISMSASAAWEIKHPSLYRLFYVGITRARKGLYILQPQRREFSVPLAD